MAETVSIDEEVCRFTSLDSNDETFSAYFVPYEFTRYIICNAGHLRQQFTLRLFVMDMFVDKGGSLTLGRDKISPRKYETVPGVYSFTQTSCYF